MRIRKGSEVRETRATKNFDVSATGFSVMENMVSCDVYVVRADEATNLRKHSIRDSRKEPCEESLILHKPFAILIGEGVGGSTFLCCILKGNFGIEDEFL
ncbi:hypothetical protein A2U01_0003933 [Trifolium medium]|uniref:Uncharacterized protein n=1 Tax=Trifolium medium TaxID=97028 RepID=A0A392M8K5_9FABA|nr:hypothetical protein [Trifolium medium]